jgi:hypothetical protein
MSPAHVPLDPHDPHHAFRLLADSNCIRMRPRRAWFLCRAFGEDSDDDFQEGPGVATQANDYRGLVQEFHKGIDYVHIIVHVI